MAILRIAADSHFYIVKGYPFENDAGEEDVFFTTMQVGPRADSLFRTIEAKDGFQIEKPLYYCLCVEGEIFFDGKAYRPPSPLKIPAKIRFEGEGLYEDSGSFLYPNTTASSFRIALDSSEKIVASGR